MADRKGQSVSRFLLAHLWRQKLPLFLLAALVVADPTLTSVMSRWLGRLFDAAVPGGSRDVVLRLLCVGFLMWLGKRLVVFSADLLRVRLVCNVRERVKTGMFSSLLAWDSATRESLVGNGEHMSVFLNDVNLMEMQWLDSLLSLISGTVSVAILGGSFLQLNARLATLILCFGFIAMIVPALFAHRLSQANFRYAQAVSGFTQKLKEYLHGMPTIHNYAVEKYIMKRFGEENDRTEAAKFEAEYMLSVVNNVGSLLSWFMQFIAVGCGILLVLRGEITVGTVLTAQSFSSNLAGPLQNVIGNLNKMRASRSILQRIQDMSAHATAAPLPASAPAEETVAPEGEGARHVDIAYQDLCLQRDGKVIVDHFTYTFEHGKKYLILGRNGSGKSSLFKALKRQLATASGSILINGTRLADMSGDELSRTISYLNENVALFSGVVRDNITLLRRHSDSELSTAVGGAQVRLDLDRSVDDDGRDISSGEQRRIEIARSLLSAPAMLVFDEVVSTLDIETAYEIEKMVLGFDDRTIVFISHNFSGKLIRAYDDILIMENGRLADHGAFDDLYARNAYFRRLCAIKFGDGAALGGAAQEGSEI